MPVPPARCHLRAPVPSLRPLRVTATAEGGGRRRGSVRCPRAHRDSVFPQGAAGAADGIPQAGAQAKAAGRAGNAGARPRSPALCRPRGAAACSGFHHAGSLRAARAPPTPRGPPALSSAGAPAPLPSLPLPADPLCPCPPGISRLLAGSAAAVPLGPRSQTAD